MTKIEWCDETVNPFVGCSECSPGCDNCYAEKIAMRMVHNPQVAHLYHGTADKNGWTGKINFNPQQLDKIATFKRPRKIFIGSMCDFFHENVMQAMVDTVINYISNFPQHTFIMLTKRPHIMKDRLEDLGRRWKSNVFGSGTAPEWPLKNLWLGVTVCNQEEANKKIPVLLCTPATKRFVSVEPMLGKIDLNKFLNFCDHGCEKHKCVDGSGCDQHVSHWSGAKNLDWVICGGETGNKARPVYSEWVYSLRDQCISAKVPFFFKQWGEWIPAWECPDSLDTNGCKWAMLRETGEIDPGDDGAFDFFDKSEQVLKVGKKAAGNLINGQEWKQFPDDVQND